MIGIVVLCNEQDMKDKIKSMLRSLEGITAKVYYYENAENLIQMLCRQPHKDIAIIYSPDGFYVSERLRMINYKIMPIIIRHSRDCSERALNSEAYRIIQIDDLRKSLEYAIRRVFMNERFLLCYERKNHKYAINLEEVVYFYSDHRVIRYKTENGMEDYFYEKLDDVVENVASKSASFIRISKSYLINIKYINGYKDYELIMSTGECLKITKTYFDIIEKTYK